MASRRAYLRLSHLSKDLAGNGERVEVFAPGRNNGKESSISQATSKISVPISLSMGYVSGAASFGKQ